jgi:ferric-dicitrate binding protein FerR (iron transport regulator)
MMSIKLKPIIKAFIESNPSSRSRRIFGKWLSSNDLSEEKNSALESIWNDIPAITRNDERGWKKIRSVIEDKPLRKRRNILRILLPVIATAAVIALFFAQHIYLVNKNKPVQFETLLCCVTAKDSKGEFNLPDGTKVWLNGSSKLYYPESLDGNIRQVRLDGEGFFDVAKDSLRPFIVDMGKRSVEVIGTAFDIKNYSNLNYQEVILVRGSVLIHSGGTDIRLKPNEKFLAMDKSKKETITNVDTEDYSHWMDKTLLFDNRPLENIFITLGRWYNMEFDIGRKVNLGTRLSFSVRNQSIDEIMRAISMITPIRYRIDYEKNIIHIY